jgi:outer membrane lipoprotein-sorting protein
MGSGARALRATAVLEFVHDTPFDDELNADTVELQGIETIGDEECYKIHVVYAGGQGVSTWYFSKKDYLPRRRTRHFDMPQGKGSLEIVITNLETEPEVSADLYKLELPEGYEQIDDFHP